MIVVDASVVFKWLVDEGSKDVSNARGLLKQFLRGKLRVTAPDILLYELANIFSNKTRLSIDDIKKAWKEYVDIKLPFFTPDIDFITETMWFSKKYGISVYDSSYIVLARKMDCTLLTADSKLVGQVKLPFVKLLIDFEGE